MGCRLVASQAASDQFGLGFPRGGPETDTASADDPGTRKTRVPLSSVRVDVPPAKRQRKRKRGRGVEGFVLHLGRHPPGSTGPDVLGKWVFIEIIKE